MLSGTAWGLPLLYRGLAVELAMDAFPRLALLVWGQSNCLCLCLAHTKHSLLSYRGLRPAFTPVALSFSRESYSSTARVFGLVLGAAIDLESRRLSVCRRSASMASITAWSRCCLPLTLNRPSGSCVARSKRIPLSTFAEEFELLNSRRYCLNHHLALM